MTYIIEEISLDDVLIKGKDRYNVNNLVDISQDDYDTIIKQTHASKWIDKFKIYKSIDIPIENWMYDACDIGFINGNFSKLYEEELDDYLNKYAKLYDNILSNGWFIRSETVSLKYGIHKCGPYYNLRQIIESVCSCNLGHSPLKKNNKVKSLKLYLIEWINIKYEFRVFVFNNNITCISVQNIYESQYFDKKTIDNIIDKINNYFNDNIKSVIRHITQYTIDIGITDNDLIYFIELNSFGEQLAAGSAGFHWIIDKDKIYNTNNIIYFRYVV